MLAIVGLLSLPAMAKQPKKRAVLYSLTGAQVANMVKAMGHTAEISLDDEGDPLVKVKSDDLAYQVVFYQCEEGACGSLQLRAWWSLDQPAQMSWMNRYNYGKRVGRAYLDGDGDPNIELSIWMNGGISQEHLDHQFNLFFLAVEGFKANLRESM
jgi:hypothetical protein